MNCTQFVSLVVVIRLSKSSFFQYMTADGQPYDWNTPIITPVLLRDFICLVFICGRQPHNITVAVLYIRVYTRMGHIQYYNI